MSTDLRRVMDDAAAMERRDAIRHLLAHPLTGQREDQDQWAAIVRHRRALVDWFAEQPGWDLVVDESGGFARLHKSPAHADITRPARAVTSSKRAFDRRRYTLWCLVLAQLDAGEGQTTLRHLAIGVTDRSRDLEQVSAFDATRYGERRALVDVLRVLVDLGVLRERDGDTERFASSDTGDALYDVDDRRIAHLVAAPSSPSLVERPEDLPVEVYSDTDEGRRLRARHRVFRRLLDDPVMHYDDLDERELDWTVHSLGFVHEVLDRDVGLVVERRAEGMLTVDPAKQVTDETFPDGNSTVKHAALLLAEVMTDRVRQRRAESPDEVRMIIPADGVVELTGALVDAYAAPCNWAARYREAEPEVLAIEAMELLERFGLVRRHDHTSPPGWEPRPALARFAPARAEQVGDEARADVAAQLDLMEGM